MTFNFNPEQYPVAYVVTIKMAVPLSVPADQPISVEEQQVSLDAIAASAIEALKERFPLADCERLTYIDLKAWAEMPGQ